MLEGNLISSPLFWIIVLLFAVGVLWLRQKIHKRRRFDLTKITLKDIDKMDGHEFEDYLYVLLSALGYEEVYQTKKSRDYGADLLFESEDGKRYVVQAKRYKEKLGLSAVQEIYTAQAYYDATQAVIVTSAGRISDPCLKLASATNVHIVDRDDLEEIIKLFKKGKREEAMRFVEEPYEHVAYSSKDSLEKPPKKRGYIQAGEYFYRL